MHHALARIVARLTVDPGKTNFGSTEEFGAGIRTETAKWGKAIRDSGARPE